MPTTPAWLEEDDDASTAFLLTPTHHPDTHATGLFVLPPAPERRVAAILTRLGPTATARTLKTGALLWTCPPPATEAPHNHLATALLPRTPGPRPTVHGNALITAGTPDWPRGLTPRQAHLTRAQLEATALLLHQHATRRAAAQALHDIARDTGRPAHVIRTTLHLLFGCTTEHASPAQLDAVRDHLLRT